MIKHNVVDLRPTLVSAAENHECIIVGAGGSGLLEIPQRFRITKPAHCEAGWGAHPLPEFHC